MFRRNCNAGFAAVALAVTMATAVSGGEPRWTWRDRPPIIVDDPVLAASVARLYAGSPRWRDALNAVADSGRRVVVITPDKVRVRDHSGGPDTPFGRGVLAEVLA